MSIFEAVVAGFIHGFAGFLPVSGSGHLAILGNLFHISTVGQGYLFFDFLLKLAAFLAVVIIFGQELSGMARQLAGVVQNPQNGRPGAASAARLLVMLVISSLPLILMIALQKGMRGLYNIQWLVGVMMLLNGFIMLCGDQMAEGRKTERSITLLDALVIGLCQCAAVIPGISHIAVCITAGLAVGLRREFAVRYTLLLSAPAFLGGAILSLIDGINQGFAASDIPSFLVGTAVALVSSMASLLLLRAVYSRRRFENLGYYCLVVGILFLILTVIF